MNTPEIIELIHLVEEKYGKCLGTTTDFEMFSLLLDKKKYGTISPSTLKRLWGYVNDLHKPRISTLDILSTYIGHKSYNKFVEWLKQSSVYNSSFFSAQQISSSDLTRGTKLTIGWLPNRIIELQYLGESMYEVINVINSKLQKGDRFISGCFIKSYPLYLPYIIRNGEYTSPFIAGRNGGLTCLNIINETTNKSE